MDCIELGKPNIVWLKYSITAGCDEYLTCVQRLLRFWQTQDLGGARGSCYCAKSNLAATTLYYQQVVHGRPFSITHVREVLEQVVVM
jgi:hypothetical protein